MANVYIKTDGKNRVTAVNSSVFLKNTEGWTQIDGGRGDRFVHAQGNYFPKPLTDENGIYVYKYENGRAAERSREEMAADIPEPVPAPPTNTELARHNAELEAQVTDLQMALCEVYELYEEALMNG